MPHPTPPPSVGRPWVADQTVLSVGGDTRAARACRALSASVAVSSSPPSPRPFSCRRRMACPFPFPSSSSLSSSILGAHPSPRAPPPIVSVNAPLLSEVRKRAAACPGRTRPRGTPPDASRRVPRRAPLPANRTSCTIFSSRRAGCSLDTKFNSGSGRPNAR